MYNDINPKLTNGIYKCNLYNCKRSKNHTPEGFSRVCGCKGMDKVNSSICLPWYQNRIEELENDLTMLKDNPPKCACEVIEEMYKEGK